MQMTLSCHLDGGMGSSRTWPAGQRNNRRVSVTCGVGNISFIKMQTLAMLDFCQVPLIMQCYQFKIQIYMYGFIKYY